MTANLVLVGGGLANSLIAFRILARDPGYPLTVVESQPTLGGNHTWSFHHSDLTRAQIEWLQPLVAHSWDLHQLRFPNRNRTIESAYSSVTSQQLHRVVAPLLGDRCLTGRSANHVDPTLVKLEDGSEIEARAVIDGRGNPGGHSFEIGYQKFLGLFLKVGNGHGLEGPVLMDATVAQRDGYRFVYTLPLSAYELLVEDTYYSDAPSLDRDRLRGGILEYAHGQGWSVTEEMGEESGVLPIVLGGNIERFWSQGPAGIPRSGMRAALFHPTTGYSLPEAVRLADEIFDNRDLNSEALFVITRRRSYDLWRATGYFRMLNRMLFRAADPEQRYRIFERFYGLPEDLIERFYAGRLVWQDKLRLLAGKPPIPIGRALRSICGMDRGRSPSRSPKERIS